MVRIHLSPPLCLPRRQVVRHQTLTLTCASSNLAEAANYTYVPLAQPVEHLTFNQRVVDSSSTRDTILYFICACVAEQVDAQDLKGMNITYSFKIEHLIRKRSV